jgi:hypothetical protein
MPVRLDLPVLNPMLPVIHPIRIVTAYGRDTSIPHALLSFNTSRTPQCRTTFLPIHTPPDIRPNQTPSPLGTSGQNASSASSSALHIGSALLFTSAPLASSL